MRAIAACSARAINEDRSPGSSAAAAFWIQSAPLSSTAVQLSCFHSPNAYVLRSASIVHAQASAGGYWLQHNPTVFANELAEEGSPQHCASISPQAAAAAVGGAGAGCQVCGAAGASGGGAGALALGLEWELDFVAGSMRPRGAVMLCSECEAAGDLPGMLNLGVAAAGGSSECRDVQRRLMAHLAQVNGVPAQGVGGTSGRRDQEDASEVWAHEVLNRAHALRVLASAAAWDLQMPEGGLEAFVSRELRERWQARAGGRGGGGAETPPPGSMKNKKRKGPRGDTPQPRRSARKAQRAQ